MGVLHWPSDRGVVRKMRGGKLVRRTKWTDYYQLPNGEIVPVPRKKHGGLKTGG